jgi:hypothetical protein
MVGAPLFVLRISAARYARTGAAVRAAAIAAYKGLAVKEAS